MRGSEFVSAFARRGLPVWEAAVARMAAAGELSPWPMVAVPVASPDGKHAGEFFATSDYLAIGEPGDRLRMPLTPRSAEAIADLFGMQLPTRKMVDAIWQAAKVKLAPIEAPMLGRGEVNRGANLAQYLAHSRAIDAQLAALGPLAVGELVAGLKKDVVVAPEIPKGKVLIYGWHRPDGSRVQPYSWVHDADGYIDYSHGIRLVAPGMQLDGQNVFVADVLKDPELSRLLSDQGPVPSPRYYGRSAPKPGSLAATLASGAAFLFAPRPVLGT